MRIKLKILWLLLAPVIVYGQTNTPDSLRRDLQVQKTDSGRVMTMMHLVDYYQENNRDSTIFYGKKMFLLAKKTNKPLDEADAYSELGYELYHLQKYPEAFQYFQLAFNLLENPENENKTWNPNRNKKGYSYRLNLLGYNNLVMGHLMGNTGNKEEQIRRYKNALKIGEQVADNLLISYSDTNLGNIYLQANKLDSALIYEKKALSVADPVNNADMSMVINYIGNIYQKKGNNSAALQYYKKAANSALKQNELTVLNKSYNNLSNYFITLKQADSALYYAKKEFEAVSAIGTKAFGTPYRDLYKSYELAHQTDSAYKYMALTLTANDSIAKKTAVSLAAFQKLSFNEQLRSGQLEKEQDELKTRIRTYVLVAAVVLFMLLALIFYRNNRQKQKANYLLHKQKEEIAAQRDNLGQTLKELKATQTQLVQREKMASLGELTAGIAHEIQNPLNFVNNFSEVNEEMLEELKAESTKPKAERDEHLESALINDLMVNEKKIRHHGKRADFIVKGMLEHSRISTGEKQLSNINVLADEFLKLSYHGLLAKDKSFNAELVTHFEEDLPKVNIVQQDIGRVLLNLFNNAFYAVNEKRKTTDATYKPTVEITTFAPPSGGWGVLVRDNGNGIPDAIKDKIMQPFFTTKPTGEGTGLGLSLSYDIVVKGHGGSITVDSTQGEGSVFTVYLPIT
jgi:two-component system NtrC family sensor kinase